MKRMTETVSSTQSRIRRWRVPLLLMDSVSSLANASNSIGFFCCGVCPGAGTPNAATAGCSTWKGKPIHFCHQDMARNKLRATVGRLFTWSSRNAAACKIEGLILRSAAKLVRSHQRFQRAIKASWVRNWVKSNLRRMGVIKMDFRLSTISVGASIHFIPCEPMRQ